MVADLPVGKNLQDHMMFPAMIHVNESISGSDWVYGFWSQLKYSLFRSGWCTIKHSALMIVVLLFNKIFFIKLFYKNVALGQNFISFYYFLIKNGYCFIQSFFISSISINICLIHKMWNQFGTIDILSHLFPF